MKDFVLGKTVWRESKRQTAARPRLRSLGTGDWLAAVSGVILAFAALCALFPGWIAPYSPTSMEADRVLLPPGAAHYFGTDYFGRDIFSVVVYGARDSLLIGVASVLAGGLAGCIIGAAAGIAGGVIDLILMRFIEIVMTIPGILLALAIAAVLGPNLFNMIFAVAVSMVPGFARVFRSQIISVKGRAFITAARSIGMPAPRIFFRHVLPNAWSPVLVMATIGLGTSILTAAGLSFLGLGVVKEIPDWGTLLSQGRGYLTVAWWISTFPGIAITLLVLSGNILGDWLRDRLDPKREQR
nr:ABC transporter permease [Thermobacillus xylanilyticus]